MDEDVEKAFEEMITAMQKDHDLAVKMIGIQRALVGAVKGLVAANPINRDAIQQSLEAEYVFLLNKAPKDQAIASFEITRRQIMGGD